MCNHQATYKLRKRICAIAVAGTVTLALGVAAWSATHALKFYEKYKLATVEPLASRGLNPAITEENSILVIGDSRAKAWTGLDQVLSGPIANLGRGGATTVQIVSILRNQLDSIRARLALVQVGINDLTASAVHPRRSTEIMDSAVSNILELVKHLEDRGIVVIYSTVFPVGTLGIFEKIVYGRDLNKDVSTLNERVIREFSPSVIVLDTTILLDVSLNHGDSKYFGDSLHLNTEGYSRLNKELAEIL